MIWIESAKGYGNGRIFLPFSPLGPSDAMDSLSWLAFFRIVSVSMLRLCALLGFTAAPRYIADFPTGAAFSASKSETMSSILSSEMSSLGGRGGRFFSLGSSFLFIEKAMKRPAIDCCLRASSSSSSG